MSWSESFPVMDATMVDEFEQNATQEERSEIKKLYQSAKIINPQNSKCLLVTSLQWPYEKADGRLPVPSLPVLTGAEPTEADVDLSLWERDFRPVVENVPSIRESFPDLTIRIYLANELSSLVDTLVDLGCEVFLMERSSPDYSLSPIWRLLAFEESDREVTLVEAHRLKDSPTDLGRTRAMGESSLSTWRVPFLVDLDMNGRVAYRPMRASQIGSNKSWPVESLLHAFTWHSQRGNIVTDADVPGCGIRPINRGRWLEDGFDEWFLGVVMYPRMAFEGMLTFVPARGRSALLTLDVEYSTWANSNSELIYFPVEGCC